jgi:hypothetical protein
MRRELAGGRRSVTIQPEETSEWLEADLARTDPVRVCRAFVCVLKLSAAKLFDAPVP